MLSSEALASPCQQKLNGHVDPDFFDNFVRERVYLRYAKQFLEAAQIDDVEVSRIPVYAGD